MARIYSPLAPVMRGRLGDAVMRKGQKSTVASKYQPSVNNPKTLAQAINRCAWATASTACSALRSIVDHSFESVNGKRANLQKFMKLNRERIYSLIMSSQDPGQKPCQLNIKGCPTIVAAPYQVSVGSLPPFWPEFEVVDEGISITADDDRFLQLSDDTISTQQHYENLLGVLGLRPGDQLSIILIAESNSIAAAYESSEGVIENSFSHVLAARVTFVSTLPGGFSGTLVNEGYFNPNLIARSEGGGINVAITIDDVESTITLTPVAAANTSISAGTIIRSELDLNGDYLYSPAQMALSPQTEKLETRLVLESYQPAITALEGSRYFLDNPSLVA